MILFKIITFVLPMTIIIFGISKISKQIKQISYDKDKTRNRKTIRNKC